MIKSYIIALAVFGLVAVIAASPQAAIVITFFTLGIGALALVVGANGFVVLGCLLPAMVVKDRFRLVGRGLSAVALAAAVFGPGFMSQRAFDALAAQETAQDVAQQGALTDKSFGGIDLLRPARLALDPRTALQPSDNCGALCQRVLHGGQFDWVRVRVKPERSGNNERSFMVTRSDAPDCADTLCFIYREDHGEAADVTVEIGSTQIEMQPVFSSVQRVVVRDNTQATSDIVWRQTEVRARVIQSLAYLIPRIDEGWNGSKQNGYNLPREDKVNQRIDPDPIAEALGLRLAAMPDLARRANDHWHKPPVPSATARIISLLDVASEISEPSLREAQAWVLALERAKTLSPEEVALVMRLTQDDRIRFPRQGRLFATKPALRAVLLPWVFDTLEDRPLFKPGMMTNLLLNMSGTVFPPAELTPYQARAIALAAQQSDALGEYNAGERARALLRMRGRFDVDPAPHLSEVYATKRIERHRVMEAICHSLPQWRDGLVPLARQIVQDKMADFPGDYPQGAIEHGMKFLIHMGHKDEVVEMVKASPWKNRNEILKRGFASEKARPTSPTGPCY